MGLFDFMKKKTKNATEISNLLESLIIGSKKCCLRNQNCEYIHENTTASSNSIVYTTDIGKAKKFDSDEDAVHLLQCLIANRAMTAVEAGNMNFIDILASFESGDENKKHDIQKMKKENPQKCLVFLAHYLEKSCLDVIVYNKRDPSVLSKLIELYAGHGYKISNDSVVVLPSQYYLDIIPNQCNEFDDIPEKVLTAAVSYADNNNFSFPEQLNMFYICFPSYNTLSFAIPIK